jgi:hypothetical protein
MLAYMNRWTRREDSLERTQGRRNGMIDVGPRCRNQGRHKIRNAKDV